MNGDKLKTFIFLMPLALLSAIYICSYRFDQIQTGVQKHPCIVSGVSYTQKELGTYKPAIRICNAFESRPICIHITKSVVLEHNIMRLKP
jgi:hypothetical protein